MEQIRLLFDVGLVTLIWMVQLVVYPSFKYHTPLNLVKWHNKYTVRISCIVIPLMVGQLFISGFQLYILQTFYTVGNFIMVIAVWALTFAFFVPTHGKIGSNSFYPKDLHLLVERNWIRTILWNMIGLWSLYEFYQI